MTRKLLDVGFRPVVRVRLQDHQVGTGRPFRQHERAGADRLLEVLGGSLLHDLLLGVNAVEVGCDGVPEIRIGRAQRPDEGVVSPRLHCGDRRDEGTGMPRSSPSLERKRGVFGHHRRAVRILRAFPDPLRDGEAVRGNRLRLDQVHARDQVLIVAVQQTSLRVHGLVVGTGAAERGIEAGGSRPDHHPDRSALRLGGRRLQRAFWSRVSGDARYAS